VGSGVRVGRMKDADVGEGWRPVFLLDLMYGRGIDVGISV
jgi:hypothetical protein